MEEPQSEPSTERVSNLPSKKTPWYAQMHTQILFALIAAVVVAGGMRAMEYSASFEVKPPAASPHAEALKKQLPPVGIRAVDMTPSGALNVVTDVGVFEASMKKATSAGYTVSVKREPIFYNVLQFLGSLFLRLLKMIIIPLVLASVIVGMTGIGDPSTLGRLGWKTMIFYTATTGLSVGVGMVVVNVLKPGSGGAEVTRSLMASATPPTLTPTPLSDVLLNIVPSNIAGAFAQGDLLSIIFVAIVFSISMVVVGRSKSEPLVRFFTSLNDVVNTITGWVMATAPIGVFALLCTVLLKTGLTLILDLAQYMFTVVVGLGVHAFVTLPLILFLVARVNPLRFAQAMLPALLTAFSTSSSSATLPITMDAVTERAGYNPQTASFVLPLGATINMDGTALYESIAAIFIAQLYGIDLTLGQQVTIFLTATLAAVGAAGVPSAGLVTMIMVLKAVGLPLEGIALIAGVDRILDMCRTTVNVWGDSVGVAVIDHFEPMQNRTHIPTGE